MKGEGTRLMADGACTPEGDSAEDSPSLAGAVAVPAKEVRDGLEEAELAGAAAVRKALLGCVLRLAAVAAVRKGSLGCRPCWCEVWQ